MRCGFNRSVLLATAFTVMSGCELPSSLPSGSDDVPEVEASKESVVAPELQVAPAPAPKPKTAARPAHVEEPAGVGTPVTDSISAKEALEALKDRNVLAKLRDVALRVAASTGVTRPARMQAVAVPDHQIAASLLSGAVVYDHAPVYVIKMTGGHFTAMRHPPGVPAPQGDVLTVTIDAATHRVTSIGIPVEEPDLGQLAPAVLDLNAI